MDAERNFRLAAIEESCGNGVGSKKLRGKDEPGEFGVWCGDYVKTILIVDDETGGTYGLRRALNRNIALLSRLCRSSTRCFADREADLVLLVWFAGPGWALRF